MKLAPNRRSLLGGLLAWPLLGGRTLAQDSRGGGAPLRIVVPLPAGGGVDVFGRSLAEPLAVLLGQTVLVENKPGAGGLLAAKAVAQSTPDGRTLIYLHSGLASVQALNPRLDLLKELQPLCKLSSAPFMAVVSAQSPLRSWQDLVASGRADPGRLSHGSGGLGSPSHLVVERLQHLLPGFRAVHVPFKGGAEAANAVVGGQVDFQVGLVAAILPLLEAGRLRALAVTSRARLAQLPLVPTMDEAGVPGFVFESWGGMAAPAGTPQALITRLSEALFSVLASAPLRALMARQVTLPEPLPAAAFAAEIAHDIEFERQTVKRLGLSNSS